jgi:phosphopantetheinyl transferase
LPRGLYAYWSTPRKVVLGRSIGGLFRDLPGIEHCAICEVAGATGKILLNRLWCQVLARMILGAEERQIFNDLKLPPLNAVSWLLGRAVAKDSVRLLRALDVCMADVSILPGPNGQPIARVEAGSSPHVSLAHRGFEAIGIAAEPDRFQSVGIDIEPLGPTDAGMAQDAFTAKERVLIELAARASGEAVANWYLGASCSKVAVGKALGRGMLGGPPCLELTTIDAASGRCTLALRGAMAQTIPDHSPGPGRTPTIDAYWRICNQNIIAICVL